MNSPPRFTSAPARPAPVSGFGEQPRDEDLLRRYAAGHHEAADELFRRYQQPAFRVALHLLGNEADASDAVQEGFYKAWRCLNQFQGRAAFRAWLLRIVRNAALELGRKRARAPRPLTASECHALDARRSDSATWFDDSAARERLDAIQSILEQHATRRIVQVFKLMIMGHDRKRIADELGVSPATARRVTGQLFTLVRERLLRRDESL